MHGAGPAATVSVWPARPCVFLSARRSSRPPVCPPARPSVRPAATARAWKKVKTERAAVLPEGLPLPGCRAAAMAAALPHRRRGGGRDKDQESAGSSPQRIGENRRNEVRRCVQWPAWPPGLLPGRPPTSPRPCSTSRRPPRLEVVTVPVTGFVWFLVRRKAHRFPRRRMEGVVYSLGFSGPSQASLLPANRKKRQR